MIKEKRLLILEDEKTDAELAVRELRRAELEFDVKRVETKEQFLKELDDFAPDLILSDFSLPQFNGLEALEMLKERDVDIPFILCTGSLTEEVAVRCMKAGASDYLLKSSLTRLPSAVINALDAAQSRRAKANAIEALRKSEQEFRAIVETTSEWIWATDLEGLITYSNPAVEDILGYHPDQVVGRSVFDLVYEEDVEPARNFFGYVLDKQTGWSQYVTRFRCRDGNIRYLERSGVPVCDPSGVLIGFRGSDRDITERKLADDRLRHDALHDRLTGLPNRTLFMLHLERLCEQKQRATTDRFAVLLIDMDRFKIINDSLGHAEGDKLLKMLAERLSGSMRQGDLVARLGGDDFTVLLTELGSEDDALQIVERTQHDLAAPFDLQGREVCMSTSIGIAINDPGPNHGEDMLRQADTAMYRAKARGLGSYQVFDRSMHRQAITQLQLESEMRVGLKRQEFVLFYQPIIQLENEEIAGFEALVRWAHPERGLVPPNDFIPAAEASGLIIPLGRWILEESCRQLCEWQNSGSKESLFVSVNISPRQFLQHDLVEQITEVLDKTGLRSSSLKLEITESHLMDNSENAVGILNGLRCLGIRISLDDFGTGYSSLSYLHRLPFDDLKIDRSFVMDMAESLEDRQIVSTIIRLAQDLALSTVAEGIETAEQLEHLRTLGCQFGQGYHFAKPLPPEAAADYIHNNSTKTMKPQHSPIQSQNIPLR